MYVCCVPRKFCRLRRRMSTVTRTSLACTSPRPSAKCSNTSTQNLISQRCRMPSSPCASHNAPGLEVSSGGGPPLPLQTTASHPAKSSHLLSVSMPYSHLLRFLRAFLAACHSLAAGLIQLMQQALQQRAPRRMRRAALHHHVQLRLLLPYRQPRDVISAHPKFSRGDGM